MDSEEVQRHLAQYGDVHIVKRCRGYLYAKFDSETAAQLVLRAAARQKLAVAGRELSVEVATARKKHWHCQIDEAYPPRVRRLQDGVVLIQHMLSMAMQSRVVQEVFALGASPQGFYTPQFGDREMKLRTFCLGKHWDTQSHAYGALRSDIDHRAVLPLPPFLSALAQGVLSDLDQKCGVKMFPDLQPDTCIVNHYTSEGSLGLHADLDESECSLIAGVPVVSMSFGCSCRFLYGKDAVLLKSGDIFIFGGPARRLSHGVAKIFPNTTPKKLQEVLPAGRLNLTFRQS